MRNLFRFALVLALLMVGVSLTTVSAADQQSTDGDSAARIGPDSQILVWNAPGLEPGRQSVDNVGELAYINGNGDLDELDDVLAQSARVEACGPNALSPDGRHLALYQGNVGGVVSSLYMITDGAEPQLVNDIFQPVSCVGGNGILNFAPDSSYVTFIEYERDFNIGFADGFLRIVSTSDLSELFSAREVVAFEQAADGVAFVRFFTNDRSEADEVAIVFWDGNTDRELTSFFAEGDCRYQNASITTAPDGQLWLGLVTRCSGITELNIYRINPQERSATLILTQQSNGVYANFAQSNRIWFSRDGSYVIYTLPDGITQQTVSLNALAMENIPDDEPADVNDTEVIIEQQMVVGGVQGQAGNNDFSRVSPDGRYLIAVVTTVNQRRNELQLVNLDDPLADPLVIPAGGEADIFPYIDFTRDGGRMVYVAGGADNSLFFLDLNAENINPIRIRRGSFQRYATLSPDGTEIAILANEYPDDEREERDRYTALRVINLDTSDEVLLFEGAEIVDGEVGEREFATPIFWFR